MKSEGKFQGKFMKSENVEKELRILRQVFLRRGHGKEHAAVRLSAKDLSCRAVGVFTASTSVYDYHHLLALPSECLLLSRLYDPVSLLESWTAKRR